MDVRDSPEDVRESSDVLLLLIQWRGWRVSVGPRPSARYVACTSSRHNSCYSAVHERNLRRTSMNRLKDILLSLLALAIFSSFSSGIENEPAPTPSRRREGMDAPTISAEPPSSSPDQLRRRAANATIDLVSDSDTDDARQSFGSGFGGGGNDDGGGDDGAPRPSWYRRLVFRPKQVEVDEPVITVFKLDTFLLDYQDQVGVPPSTEDVLEHVLHSTRATHVRYHEVILPREDIVFSLTDGFLLDIQIPTEDEDDMFPVPDDEMDATDYDIEGVL